MNGIIYKMTIVRGCDIFNHNPYYVGQHWGETIEDYFGSGEIWKKVILKIKRKLKSDWKNCVKKEILFSGNVSQKTLNALEKFYIKKCCSLYSLKLGGCNINEGGNNICPSKSEIAREKIRLSHLGDKNPIHKHVFTQEEKDLMRNRRLGVKMSDESKKKLSESRRGMILSEETKKKISEANMGNKNPNYGKRGEETSMYGKRQTEYQKRVMKERMSGSNNPMYGKVSPNKGKTMSDEQKKKISIALSGRKIDESKILRGEKHWAYGKHFSEETRKKMSKSQSGRRVSSETKEKMRISALKRYGKL